MAIAICVLFWLAGFGLLTAGTFVLHGLGWALVAGGLSCLLLAGLLSLGIRDG